MTTRFNLCDHGKPGVACMCKRCVGQYRRTHARLRDQLALVVRGSWETLSLVDREKCVRIFGLLVSLGLILCGQPPQQEAYDKFVGARKLSDVQRDLAWLERVAEIG
jgi:hypothetical protein